MDTISRRLLLLLLLSLPALAQNARYDSIALGPKGSIPFAAVAVCTQPANVNVAPCTPAASLCLSATDAVCNQPSTLTSDSLGNFHFYIRPGTYTVQIYGPQVAAPFALVDQSIGQLTLSASGFTGADNSAKIQAAINALPSTGGTVDGRALPSETSGGSTIIDAGTKTVTILFPPGITFINQILLRNSLHLYGMGSGGFSQQTILQSCATCGTTDMIVIGGTSPVTGIVVQGLRIYGANGSGGSSNQSAIALIAAINGGGVWWSRFQDLNILGFAGSGGTHGVVRLDGSAGGSPPGIQQWDSFADMEVYRTTGGGPALEINGMNGQLDFLKDHFDAQPLDLTGTNVLIKDVSSSLFPYSLNFINFTDQGGAVGFSLAGCNECSFRQIHMEKTLGGFLVTTSSGANSMIQIEDSQFNGNVGINAGNGYLVNITAPSTNASVLFTGNNFTTPDHVISGNIAGFTSYGNTGGTLVSASFQWNALNAFSNLTVNTGIQQNGSGFKHSRGTAGCATAASVGATCTTTVTWATAFNDASYTPNCTGDAITSGVPLNGGITARVAASVTFQTVAATAAAAQFTNIDCIAVHDTVAGP